MREPDGFDFVLFGLWWAGLAAVGTLIAGGLVAWQFDVPFARAAAGAGAAIVVISAGVAAGRPP